MGDFRFSFKATFTMGNVEDTCDMWLNWSPGDDAYPVDHRVISWLQKNFSDGIADIRDATSESRRKCDEQNLREEENRILAEADAIRARREAKSAG